MDIYIQNLSIGEVAIEGDGIGSLISFI